MIPVERIKDVINWLEGEISYMEYKLFGLVRLRLGKVYREKAAAYRECQEHLQRLVKEYEPSDTGKTTV